jgi:hypothetical protein
MLESLDSENNVLWEMKFYTGDLSLRSWGLIVLNMKRPKLSCALSTDFKQTKQCYVCNGSSTIHSKFIINKQEFRTSFSTTLSFGGGLKIPTQATRTNNKKTSADR